MANSKITWTDKESLVTDPTIAEINKVTDSNMNEIKSVVNENADQTIVSDTEPTSTDNEIWVDTSSNATYINSEISNEYGTAENIGYSQSYLNDKIINIGTMEYELQKLKGQTEQNGTPTPSSPVTINVVKGNNTITINNTDYSLNLGSIELCKIGNYTDYIYKNGNKWYKHSAIKKYAFTGQENFTKVSEGFYFQVTDLSLTTNRTIFCNNYKNYLNYSPFVGSNYGISFLYNNSQLYIKDKDVSTVSALQTKLVNNNVVMYYILNTTTDTEITDTTLINQLNAIETNIINAENITQTNADLPIKIDLGIKVSI